MSSQNQIEPRFMQDIITHLEKSKRELEAVLDFLKDYFSNNIKPE